MLVEKLPPLLSSRVTVMVCDPLSPDENSTCRAKGSEVWVAFCAPSTNQVIFFTPAGELALAKTSNTLGTFAPFPTLTISIAPPPPALNPGTQAHPLVAPTNSGFGAVKTH